MLRLLFNPKTAHRYFMKSENISKANNNTTPSSSSHNGVRSCINHELNTNWCCYFEESQTTPQNTNQTLGELSFQCWIILGYNMHFLCLQNLVRKVFCAVSAGSVYCNIFDVTEMQTVAMPPMSRTAMTTVGQNNVILNDN